MNINFFKVELQQKVNIKLEHKYNEIYKKYQILETHYHYENNILMNDYNKLKLKYFNLINNYNNLTENVNNKYEIIIKDAIIKYQDINMINNNNYNKLLNNYNLLLKDYEYLNKNLNLLIEDNKKIINNNSNNKIDNKMIYNLKFLTSI